MNKPIKLLLLGASFLVILGALLMLRDELGLGSGVPASVPAPDTGEHQDPPRPAPTILQAKGSAEIGAPAALQERSPAASATGEFPVAAPPLSPAAGHGGSTLEWPSDSPNATETTAPPTGPADTTALDAVTLEAGLASPRGRVTVAPVERGAPGAERSPAAEGSPPPLLPSDSPAEVTGWPTAAATTVVTPPPAAAVTRYQTKANDSLWELCVRHYGNGAFYKALYAHNRVKIRDPAKIEAGLELEIPSEPLLRKRYPDLCPADARES